jgi:hypothetical protein
MLLEKRECDASTSRLEAEQLSRTPHTARIVASFLQWVRALFGCWPEFRESEMTDLIAYLNSRSEVRIADRTAQRRAVMDQKSHGTAPSTKTKNAVPLSQSLTDSAECRHFLHDWHRSGSHALFFST